MEHQVQNLSSLLLLTVSMDRGEAVNTLSIRYRVSCDTINEILDVVKATTESDTLSPEILQEVFLLSLSFLVLKPALHSLTFHAKQFRYQRPNTSYSGSFQDRS